MKKLAMVLGVVLLAATVSSNALAFRGGGGMGPGGGYGPGFGYNDRMMSNLNLTPEQTAKVGEMREALQKEMVPIQNKLFAKRNELRLLWLQKTPDEGKITAANQEVRTLRGQIQDKMTSHRLAVRNILTPEQQAKIQSYGGNGRGYGRMGGRGGCQTGYGRGQGYGPRSNW